MQFVEHNWSKADIIAYDNFSIKVRDEIEERIAAEEKGKNLKEKEIVIEMYKNNLPIELIVKITKLSTERVQQIISEYEQL